MKLRCIAVDDEPLALGLVCAFIEKTPFLELVGRYSSAVEALHALNEHAIDILFLDIQMPDLTGIELARVLEKSGTQVPRIIFTTAFNHYALEGYRVDALDYLLKPFSYEEFLRAASKAKAFYELIRKSDTTAPIAPNKEEYLFLKVEYQLVRVAFDDLLYIEGLKDYVKVHVRTDSRPLLSLISLKSLEEKLPTDRFMRIHRSYIINLDKINAITRSSVQIGSTSIPVSDQYKDVFASYVSRWI